MQAHHVYHLYFRSSHFLLIFLSFTFSFILHVLLIVMLLSFQSKTFIKKRERFITVSIYVNKEIPEPLFSPSMPSLAINTGISAGSTKNPDQYAPTTARLIPKEISRDTLIEESLHAIKAKKKIEKLARLRAEIIKMGSLTVGRPEVPPHSESKIQEQSGSLNEADYSNIVRVTIQRNWHYPELAKKGLSATVIAHIGKDGAVRIIDFKTSGERLFDYSVKNAILKASPLPPPPRECEIELRFSR